jgi:glycosyltransferase involved in cell wall biosynthesis
VSTKLEPGRNLGRVRFLIAGMARSGTTVAQRLVTEVDGVWVPAETHFWRYAAGMARRFLFPLDREQATIALQWFADLDSSRHLSFDPAEVARGLPDQSFQWDVFVALVRALSPPGADLLGEKTPDHLRWAEQLLTAVPDVCLIGLIRDPREVYRSHCSVPWGIADPFVFAEKWLELSRRLRDCKRLFGPRVLTVLYEEMVADPTAFQKQAAGLLDPDGARSITARVDLIGLFPPEETWKAGALEPVAPRKDQWRSELPRHAVRILESACREEMVSWGYEPTTSEGSHVSPDSLAETRRVRTAAERIDAVPLPITEQQTAEWTRSDARAAAVLEMTAHLPRQIRREPATRQAAASRDLAAARGALDLWRARAEVLQGEESRLRKQITQEQILRLRSERAQLVAEGHLRRFQARRWWQLGRALGAWRRRPWRLDRLVRTCLALLVRPAAFPPMPSLNAINVRLVELGVKPATPEPTGDSGLQEATQLYRKGEYEAALARLEELAPATRSSRRACLIARDCHVRLGELHATLADVRRALESGPDKALERQARQLVGRIRETDPSWLPDAGPPLDNYRPADGHRVLHIVKESLPFFERGYTLRSHATFLAQKLAGFDPVVVTSLGFPRQQGFDPFPLTEMIDGIEHHRLDLGPAYNLREVPFDLQLSDQATLTRELAEQLRPALIQAGSGYRGFETALVGLAVAKCLGVPFIYEVRSFLEHTWTGEIERSESGEQYHRRRQQELRCMLEADHVITIAEGMRDHIVARGVPAEKVSVVPNVVDVDRFTPRDADLELQRKYGIEGRPVLGYISNLGQREGIEHLIRAVAILRDQGMDVAGLVVGEGPSGEALERLVGELGLTGHVVLTGHVDNHRIEDHYAMIDLFVIPRIDDLASRLVVPLKPLEAMAMQRPVIAADLPALRELVAPGERGEVFSPGNPKALAAVAEKLIAYPDQRARLARGGRSWVLRERTIAANARRYAKTLLTATGGGQ